MDRDDAEVELVAKISREPKIHEAICGELVKATKKIGHILPAIESARPGSSSGIQVLCSLNNALQKAKLLVHYCSESSKLYLALTAESIVSRCERIRTQLSECLCQIQTMVPLLLASQIADVLNYLSEIKFICNPDEEEAAKVLLNLLSKINLTEDQEFEAFQIVSSRLNITSSKSLLVERRAIRKLLDKFQNIDNKKERILKYFLFLLKKYGRQSKPNTGEHNGNSKTQTSCLNERINTELDACINGNNERLPPNNVELRSPLFNGNLPPEEFFCPISSSLMFDPVVIDSGQTYERIFIEKWFIEGHDTCPKTKKKLKTFCVVSNSCMKDLISSWCKKHGVIIQAPCTQPEEFDIQSLETSRCNSISSLKNISTALLYGAKGVSILESERDTSSSSSGSCCFSDSSSVKDIESLSNGYVQFSWSNDYRDYRSFTKFSLDMYMRFLTDLSELPTVPQAEAVNEIERILGGDEASQFGMLSSVFAEALMVFLKKACSLNDLEAQRSGTQILLALVSNQCWELNFKNEDTIQMLSSFFNCGIDIEVLMILQKIILHPNYASCVIASSIPLEVIKFLYSEKSEYVEIATKILAELSSNKEMKSHFLSSGCIEKIGQHLSNQTLLRHCLNILQNLADDEEASSLIADANECIASFAEILEFGNPSEQEQAVSILLSLCSRGLRICLLVLKEGVIPSLVDISVNGNAKGKENAMRLLHVLRDIRQNDCIDNLQPHLEAESEIVKPPMKNSKKLVSNYRSFGFFSRKMKFVSKSLSLF